MRLSKVGERAASPSRPDAVRDATAPVGFCDLPADVVAATLERLDTANLRSAGRALLRDERIFSHDEREAVLDRIVDTSARLYLRLDAMGRDELSTPTRNFYGVMAGEIRQAPTALQLRETCRLGEWSPRITARMLAWIDHVAIELEAREVAALRVGAANDPEALANLVTRLPALAARDREREAYALFEAGRGAPTVSRALLDEIEIFDESSRPALAKAALAASGEDQRTVGAAARAAFKLGADDGAALWSTLLAQARAPAALDPLCESLSLLPSVARFDAFRRLVDRASELPATCTLLARALTALTSSERGPAFEMLASRLRRKSSDHAFIAMLRAVADLPLQDRLAAAKALSTIPALERRSLPRAERIVAQLDVDEPVRAELRALLVPAAASVSSS